MMNYIKKNKKAVMLIIAGIIGLAGTYVGINEDVQKQIVELIATYL